jgi:hypothetical protein
VSDPLPFSTSEHIHTVRVQYKYTTRIVHGMANAITLVEMVDLTLADLKAEIAILKSSAARDISTTIASPFAPSHKHHPTPYGTTTTPAKPKCAAHSAVDSPPVPALQARLKRQSVSNAEGLEGAFGDDTEVTVLSGSVEELSEDAVREEDRSAREILLDDFLTPKNGEWSAPTGTILLFEPAVAVASGLILAPQDISSVEMTTTATQDIESSSNKLSALEQMVLEQNHLSACLRVNPPLTARSQASLIVHSHRLAKQSGRDRRAAGVAQTRIRAH